MMRHLGIASLTIALTAIAFAVTTDTAAAAGPSDEYKSAMRYFVDDIEDWADDLETTADAAVVKPELACAAEMKELSRIAGWIADDLEGTAWLAPGHLSAAHAQLTSSVVAMGEIAAGACDNPAAAAAGLDETRDGFDRALAQIEYFTNPRFGGN